ncbi:MAG TPA: FecR domain-containing protein [Prolixibacteraceae bacterium]|nr:FecR domain-containing protein [Prolixibacteraceae bacterium]
MENQVPIYKVIRNIATNGVEYSKEIQQWMNVSDENKKVYQDLLNIWQITGSFPERYTPDGPKAWQKVHKQIHSQKRKYFLYRRIGQIAAAIVVVFISVWTGTELNNWKQKPHYTEVISLAGQKTRIILPDSSIVLLNGNSKIRYNQNFNKNSRKVELKGEGYFDVRKDASKQFIVSTSELNVKVFGTSFNVKSYEDDQTIEVGLKTGKVGIERNEKEIIQLSPGEVVSFDKKEKELDVKRMDVDLVSAWIRDEMVFDEDSLEEIIKYMERWYGVSIQVSPILLDGELLTFKVKTESLNELLKLINLLKPIKYHIDGKQVIITKP